MRQHKTGLKAIRGWNEESISIVSCESTRHSACSIICARVSVRSGSEGEQWATTIQPEYSIECKSRLEK